MFQPPEWPLLILLFLRSRAFLHTLTPLLKLDKSTTNKKNKNTHEHLQICMVERIRIWFLFKKKKHKEVTFYPNSPQPNRECPRNRGSVQEGEQGVQMHKSTLLGNEDFHLKKKQTRKTSRLFPGFEHGKQSTSHRWEELWTNDPILQPKKQTTPPSSNIFTNRFPPQILGIFMQFTQKTPITRIMIITKPQPVALECFPRQKKGQIAFAVWCRIIG